MTFASIRKGLVYTALFALTGLVAASLNAQSTTQGAISGTVEDPTGAVVAGAKVTIHNMATDTTVVVTTGGSGYFNAPLLEPGNYAVSISAPGFAPYRADNVVIVVGQVTTVLPHLAMSSAAAEVVVTEQTPVMNLQSPDFNDTLNSVELQNIPINNRRWSALAMTTPGVIPDTSGFGLVSIRGISTLLNNVEIDGADDNEAYYSEERGRTREAYSTSGSAVREFAVNTGVYSAEYGRAAGGVITSVTKSGTNQIHGQAYFWDRESNWNAYNDYTTEAFLNSSTGLYVSQHIKPEDLRKIYGFTVGGPLKKDKLFWIYTYDQHTHVFPAAAIPENASAFYTLPNPSPTFTGGYTATTACNLSTGALSGDTNALDADACTLAARQGYTNGATSAYAQGVAAYDLWIGNLNSDLGTVPRFGYQEINTPKLDWQINDKEHLSVLFHRLRWDSPGGVQTSTSADYARDTFGNDFVKLDYGVTKLTSLITSNISNEVLYQYSRELLDENQQPLTAYTKANLIGNGPSVNNSIPEVAMDTTEGFNLGSPYYSYRLANPEEWKWQVGDILYWNKGNHSLRFGVDELHNYDFNNTYGGDGNGYYTYSYVGNYIDDQMNFLEGRSGTNTGCTTSEARNTVGNYPCYSSFVQTFGPHVYGIGTLDTGAFAQDNWKLSPRLTLELGLRWDYESLPPADPNLTTATGSFVPYPQLLNNPSDKKNFGPRIGFSYDVYGGGNTVLRGGYGVYYGRITNGELLNIRFNTGSPNSQYNTTYKVTTAGYPTLPNIVAGTGAATAVPSSNYLAANLRNPQVQEFDLQLQQAVGKSTFLALSYLGSLGRELPNFLDVNLNPNTVQYINVTVADPTNSGPLGPNGTIIQNVKQYTSYGNTALFGSVADNYQIITEMISNINSNYNAFVAEILNRSLRSVQFDVNYTWSHSLDYGQNADTTSVATNNWYDPYSDARINYGDSQWNTPDRFVAYALYNLPNLHTNSFARYVTNDWSVDDSFQMSSGLPYTVGVSGFFSPGILSDWNGASGSTMIPNIGPNTERYPRHEVDDVRLQKSVDFEQGRSLQLMCNVFNVANHQNVDGLGTTAYKISGTTATFQNTTYQIPTSSNNSGFLFTPREVEIAAKFIF
jgi:Carboxypeptidase regulatory-like domain/TonB-dependent Receptor Plug Domain